MREVIPLCPPKCNTSAPQSFLSERCCALLSLLFQLEADLHRLIGLAREEKVLKHPGFAALVRLDWFMCQDIRPSYRSKLRSTASAVSAP